MFNLGAAASNVRDYSAARYWFELAEKAGDTDAKKMLKRLPRR
jgi:TPR repeat protein